MEFSKLNEIPISMTPDAILRDTYSIGISYSNFFLLKDSHISRFEKGIFNFHGADITKYKGSAAPVFHILESDKNNFGYTYHQINSRLDDGDILMIKKFCYSKNLTSQQINSEIVRRSIQDIPEFILKLREYIDGNIVLSKNESSAQARRRSELFGREETTLSFESSELEKLLRAFDWPELFKHPLVRVNNQRIRLVPEKTYEELLKIFRRLK